MRFLFWVTSHPRILAAAQQVTSDAYRGGVVKPPLPKPGFVLTDTSGAPFDFWNRTEGSVTLLFFGYTYCPDQCPMHMANLGAALKKLPRDSADQVKLVFVTTDPARDTPAVLRRWLDYFDKRFIGLTGTEAALEAVQKRRAFLWPQSRAAATATIPLRTPILLLLTRKTISRMSSIRAE